MRVRVEGTSAGGCSTAVLEAAALTGLVVELVQASPEQADRALADAGLGRLRDGHAWLDVAALTAAAVQAAATERDVQAMIGYAGSRGWLSSDGGQVRAHCEQVERPPGESRSS